jgi:hypothetical protein
VGDGRHVTGVMGRSRNPLNRPVSQSPSPSEIVLKVQARANRRNMMRIIEM